MTGDEGSAPDGDPGIAGRAGPLPFDTSVAHQARIYNYVLGGKDNYAADRAAAEAWMKVYPQLTFDMRANRAFLGRVVRYLAGEAGIRQFLDIGTGIPAAGNTHEIAQEVAPESRIVYVDYDPVVLAHARALLISHPAGATAYIDADLRDTGTILDRARQVLDFTKPVAVTLLAILHAVPEADDPYTVVQTLLDAGASVAGKTITDEVSLGILGENAHDGTPLNPAAPGRVPGGSSSGSASAVAAKACDFALGTDTGGSVRVPSSFCGLYGIRPTHGRIDFTGIAVQASGSDTCGWIARDAATFGEDSFIFKFDPKSGKILGKIESPAHQLSVAPDGTLLPGTRTPTTTSVLLLRPLK